MAVSLKLQEPEAFPHCGSASSRSDWTAASITPDKTIRARARSNHNRALNDDRSAGGHNHWATVGVAPPINTPMPAGSASAFGIGRIKAEDSYGKQHSTE
jgi:hypothetical protein